MLLYTSIYWVSAHCSPPFIHPLSLGGDSLIASYLIINSLKHRRSLLWWRKSFGSAGISFKKTWATSNGPYKQGAEIQGNQQKQRSREMKKEKAKRGWRKEREEAFWQQVNKGGIRKPLIHTRGNDLLPEWLNAAKSYDSELKTRGSHQERSCCDYLLYS